MNGKKRTWFIFGKIDLVLITVALTLAGIGAILLRLSPAWWGWYVSALDVRIWPWWKCIGMIIVLWGSLLMIRRWPSKKRRRPVKLKQGKE